MIIDSEACHADRHYAIVPRPTFFLCELVVANPLNCFATGKRLDFISNSQVLHWTIARWSRNLCAFQKAATAGGVVVGNADIDVVGPEQSVIIVVAAVVVVVAAVIDVVATALRLIITSLVIIIAALIVVVATIVDLCGCCLSS